MSLLFLSFSRGSLCVLVRHRHHGRRHHHRLSIWSHHHHHGLSIGHHHHLRLLRVPLHQGLLHLSPFLPFLKGLHVLFSFLLKLFTLFFINKLCLSLFCFLAVAEGVPLNHGYKHTNACGCSFKDRKSQCVHD